MGFTEALGWVLALAGAITTIGAAADRVAKAVKVAKAPNHRQDERIGALEQWRIGVDEKLGNDKKRLDTMEAGNRVTQLALLALLDHGIDGNNLEQMQHAKEELQNHLISR